MSSRAKRFIVFVPEELDETEPNPESDRPLESRPIPNSSVVLILNAGLGGSAWNCVWLVFPAPATKRTDDELELELDDELEPGEELEEVRLVLLRWSML